MEGTHAALGIGDTSVKRQTQFQVYAIYCLAQKMVIK